MVILTRTHYLRGLFIEYIFPGGAAFAGYLVIFIFTKAPVGPIGAVPNRAIKVGHSAGGTRLPWEATILDWAKGERSGQLCACKGREKNFGTKRKRLERTPLHSTRVFQSIFRWALQAHAQRRTIITLKRWGITFFSFFSFLVVRDRSEISGNYFDFASLLPPLVQKGKRNNEIHTFFPPASRRMNAQFLSNRVSYLLFPSLRLDFFFVWNKRKEKKKPARKCLGFIYRFFSRQKRKDPKKY